MYMYYVLFKYVDFKYWHTIIKTSPVCATVKMVNLPLYFPAVRTTIEYTGNPRTPPPHSTAASPVRGSTPDRPRCPTHTHSVAVLSCSVAQTDGAVRREAGQSLYHIPVIVEPKKIDHPELRPLRGRPKRINKAVLFQM